MSVMTIKFGGEQLMESLDERERGCIECYYWKRCAVIECL